MAPVKSLEQERQLVRLARRAGSLSDVVLLWPDRDARICSGPFEITGLDAEIAALAERCVRAAHDLRDGEISRVPLADSQWVALCDRRCVDRPIIMMRGPDGAAQAPVALACAETVFDVLRDLKASEVAPADAVERDEIGAPASTGSVGIGSWQLSIDDNCVSFSEETLRIHGLDPGSAAPSVDEAVRFFEPEVRDIVTSNIAQAVADKAGYSFALPFRRADGTRRIVRSMGYVVTDACGHDQLYGLYQDVTEERERELRLWSAMNLDALTGVHSRYHWQQRLDSALADAMHTGGAVGLILVDIVDFKILNDCHGHDAGDEALKAVAATLSANLRSGDVLARLGGDAFAILVSDLKEPDNLGKLVERLSGARKVTFDHRGAVMTVEFALGAAAFPTDAETAENSLPRRGSRPLPRQVRPVRRRDTLRHGAPAGA